MLLMAVAATAAIQHLTESRLSAVEAAARVIQELHMFHPQAVRVAEDRGASKAEMGQ